MATHRMLCNSNSKKYVIAMLLRTNLMCHLCRNRDNLLCVLHKCLHCATGVDVATSNNEINLMGKAVQGDDVRHGLLNQSPGLGCFPCCITDYSNDIGVVGILQKLDLCTSQKCYSFSSFPVTTDILHLIGECFPQLGSRNSPSQQVGSADVLPAIKAETASRIF